MEWEWIEAQYFESAAQPKVVQEKEDEFGCLIKITDTQVVQGGYFGYGSYVQYKIETRAKGIPGLNQGSVYSVWRRFNDFKALNSCLSKEEKFKGLIIPPLPENTYTKNFDDEFVNAWWRDLEKYLQMLASLKHQGTRSVIVFDKIFKDFLTLSAEEIKEVQEIPSMF